jgi:Na+-transporting methylmalonyl-CoA/oxaloacetate decarboxylase gamma subunit
VCSSGIAETTFSLTAGREARTEETQERTEETQERTEETQERPEVASVLAVAVG